MVAITQGCASAASRWSRRQSTSPPMDADCLIIHGDSYDLVVKHARWLAVLGDGAYRLPYGPIITSIKCAAFSATTTGPFQLSWKMRVKNAVQYIGSFADALADEARRRDLDGVVCGHIHHARSRTSAASCTARRRLGGKLHGPGRAFRWPASTSSNGPRTARHSGSMHRLRSGAGRADF